MKKILGCTLGLGLLTATLPGFAAVGELYNINLCFQAYESPTSIDGTMPAGLPKPFPTSAKVCKVVTYMTSDVGQAIPYLVNIDLSKSLLAPFSVAAIYGGELGQPELDAYCSKSVPATPPNSITFAPYPAGQPVGTAAKPRTWMASKQVVIVPYYTQQNTTGCRLELR